MSRRQKGLVIGLLGLCVAGCGDDGPHVQSSVVPVTQSGPTGDCSVVQRSYAGGSSEHLAECSDIRYATSPPVFGDHYPVWAAYQTYDFAVPLGYLVHDLEHGAMVIFYDCPDGCDDEVASAQAFIDALPDDPRCGADVRLQVILVPRPGLGSRWAASTWGHSLNADCLDPQAFAQFYRDHHAQGRENLCNPGTSISRDSCR
jgi:uncharacterized protein DUF3105